MNGTFDSSDLNFGSIDELYHHVKPALFTRQQEMKRNGFSYITEMDVWNYLAETKWKHSRGLSTYDMVRDILNSDELAIDHYLKGKLNSKNRVCYFDTER